MNSSDSSLLFTPHITLTKGIKGIIKQIPEDFIVGEIIENHQILDPRLENFDLPGNKGLFLHFILIKKNIDTSSALDWIAKLWKIPRNNLSIAGSKDKKALTGQRVSVWGVKNKFENSQLQEVDFPTMKTKSLCVRSDEIRLGNLWGNFFDITIRKIDFKREEIKEMVEKTLDAIDSKNGILNSFGIQRFGENRPITHIIGKKLLEGDMRGALKNYIGKTFGGESDNVEKARRIFWETEDVKETIGILPSHLRIERKILYELNSGKNNYLQAFNTLPVQFRKLFIHAYQSYLFNRYLRIRYEKYSNSLREPLLGEKEKEGEIYIPIVGSKTQLTGKTKEIYEKIFEEEEISMEKFQKPFIKKIGGKGTFRRLSCKPEKLQIEDIDKDDLNQGKNKLRLSFEIRKGSYATEILREIMK